MRLVVQRMLSVVVKHGLGGGAFMRPWAHGLMSAFEWLPRAPLKGVGQGEACGHALVVHVATDCSSWSTGANPCGKTPPQSR
jgi:hypothetical protein